TALLLASAVGAVRAQGLNLIPGVPEIPDDDLQDVALAVVDRVDPVIYYNPARFQRYGPDLANFFLAHEYGHVALHHTRVGLDHLSDDDRDAAQRSQELEADCWAAGHIGGDHRTAIEAAIRFFTRLGPFRFDRVHPTGAQRAERLLACLPPDGGRELVQRDGDTGVETGPVSGEPRPVRVEVRTGSLSEDEIGREIQIWFDGRPAGRLSNMRLPLSLMVASLSAGVHSYRMQIDVYPLDGLQQFRAAGSIEGRGYLAVTDGDVFVVRWSRGKPPVLELQPQPMTGAGC
ncbi:MAG TPA: hypothetical protein VMJ30_07510, partial [Gemmatimonadales bacterium]|nr:hypothetical protein [Gemmatimonadales bacterium]